ncbi:MAG: hypothetical protein R3F43_28825 [bacterium]
MLDQLSRNMFRHTPEMYAADARAGHRPGGHRAGR